MTKKYQTIDAAAQAMSVPERVSIAMNEIAADVSEGLLALAVGAGLQVLTAMMAEDVSALCGPVGRHDRDRVGYRHGTEVGSVPLGGRRVPVRRPRVRAADGSGEVLGRLAMSRMLAGLSTRRYPSGLEPVGAVVESGASGTSRSAVSRRFVARTETALVGGLTPLLVPFQPDRHTPRLAPEGARPHRGVVVGVCGRCRT